MLTPIEGSILEIAKKLLKIGALDIERLYKISILHLGCPKEEIDQAIYQLFSRKILVKDSKITKDTILNNNTRRNIFNYIIENTGTHLREIRNKLNLTPHQTAWHLKMLEKFDLIRKARINEKVAYFFSKIDSKYDKSIVFLRDTNNLRILEQILLEPGIYINDLAKRIKIKSQIIENIALFLKKLNLIYVVRENDTIRYFGKIKKLETLLKLLNVPEVEIIRYKEIGNY